MSKRMDPDVRALMRAVEWIEKSSSERVKRATAEYIYDRYIRHPIAPLGHSEGGESR